MCASPQALEPLLLDDEFIEQAQATARASPVNKALRSEHAVANQARRSLGCSVFRSCGTRCCSHAGQSERGAQPQFGLRYQRGGLRRRGS